MEENNEGGEQRKENRKELTKEDGQSGSQIQVQACEPPSFPFANPATGWPECYNEITASDVQ